MAKTPTDPVTALFKAKLRTMSVAGAQKYAQAQGWSMEEFWGQTWTDPTGYRWSTFSRLGYLMATSNETMMNNQAFLKEGLRDHHRNRGGGLERQTQSGTPDLVWAYLGSHNVLANGSLESELKQAFVKATHPNPEWPAAGVGLPGDGGWLDCMLGLVEKLAAEEKVAPRGWSKWFEQWHRANLLGVKGQSQFSWWHLGQRGVQLVLEEAKGRLPYPPPGKFTIRDSGRPAALAEGDHFSRLWERTVRLAANCLAKSDQALYLVFPRGGLPEAERVDLAPFLETGAWDALDQYVLALKSRVVDVSALQRYEVSTITSAMSLWVEGPQAGVTEEQKGELRDLLLAMKKTFEPRGWEMSSRLTAWAKEHSLNKSLEEPAPAAPTRPRF